MANYEDFMKEQIAEYSAKITEFEELMITAKGEDLDYYKATIPRIQYQKRQCELALAGKLGYLLVN
jgi:hypothetical protein